MQNKVSRLILAGLMLLSFSACTAGAGPDATPTATAPVPDTATLPPATSTPTTVLADSSFSGCAFLDQNNNHKIDDGDVTIAKASFSIKLSDGTGFGDQTDNTGCAYILIPGGLKQDAWPIEVRMDLPAGTFYLPEKSNTLLLAYPDTHADFLFYPP